LEADIWTINGVLRACMHVAKDEQETALEISLKLLEEIKNISSIIPNSSTYCILFQYSLTHSSTSTEILNAIFKQCCRDGMVNDAVLKELRKLTPSQEIFNSILGVLGNDTADFETSNMFATHNLRKEWSRNVKI